MEFLELLMHLDSHIAGFIAAHGNLTYLLLFTVILIEIGVFPLFFLPGNPLIFISGTFCKIGSLSLVPTLVTLISATVLGHMLAYQIGKLFGHKISHSQSSWVNQKALNKTKVFYRKYGQWTLIVSPFIAVVRTFAPLLAGIGQMLYKQYVFSSVIGATLWVGTLVFAGYFLSDFAFIQQHIASIILAGLAVGLCFVLYGLLKAKRKSS